METVVEASTAENTLRKLKATSTSQKIKAWDSLKSGVYFYCSGIDDSDDGDGEEYHYISKIVGASQDESNDWEAEDIWDSREVAEGTWVASKEIFMTHKVFVIIEPKDYPEYFL